MILCTVCNGRNIVPIVYAETEAELGICRLGWATIGSKLTGPPYSLWYCADCHIELSCDALEAFTREAITSHRFYEARLSLLLSKYSRLNKEECKLLYGKRWLDHLSVSIDRGAEYITINYDEFHNAVVTLHSPGHVKVTEMPTHMFDELLFYLLRTGGDPGKLGDSSVELHYTFGDIACDLISNREVRMRRLSSPA